MLNIEIAIAKKLAELGENEQKLVFDVLHEIDALMHGNAQLTLLDYEDNAYDV
jgi:hypothetical protein